MSDETRPGDGAPMVTPEGGPAIPVWRANGKELLAASWDLLRRDKQLIVLPFLGGAAGVIAALLLFGPGYGITWLVNGHENSKAALYAGVAVSAFGATVVGVFFQTALVIGANERADGGAPTVRGCIRGAWDHRWRIVQWSILTATVGLVLQLIEERLGFLGRLINVAGSFAWGVATFMVVPVIVAEGLGPVAAVRRSSSVLRSTWGTSLRFIARSGLLWGAALLVPALVFGVGLAMTFSGDATIVPLALCLVVISSLTLVVVGTVTSGISVYARTLTYRYATGQPTPDMPLHVLAGAFRPRGV